MTTLFRSLCLMAACLVSTERAAAHDIDVEERVRAYLLENPEVILQALTILSEREEKAVLLERIAAFGGLFDGPPLLGIGRVDAPVRIVKFFDYRCAPCKAIHPDLVAFVAEHPEVRIEMRHLPILSPASERAARFSLAAQEVLGLDAYAQVHDALWHHRGALTWDAFAGIAADLGLDFAPIEAAMQSDGVTRRITYNRDAAIALEVLGTPSFVTPTSLHIGGTDVEAMSAEWLSR